MLCELMNVLVADLDTFRDYFVSLRCYIWQSGAEVEASFTTSLHFSHCLFTRPYLQVVNGGHTAKRRGGVTRWPP